MQPTDGVMDEIIENILSSDNYQFFHYRPDYFVNQNKKISLGRLKKKKKEENQRELSAKSSLVVEEKKMKENPFRILNEKNKNNFSQPIKLVLVYITKH